VLLPAAALAGLTPAQLDALLAHELAHVRRHDYLVNLLQSLAETLLFYHPAAHWLSRRVRAEREHVCDDLAVEATGDAITYARALVALEELRRRTCRTPQFALAADGGSLRHRVQRLLLAPRRTRQPPRPYALGAAAAFAAALLVCAHALAVGPGGGRGAAGLDGSPASRARRRVAVTFVSLPMIHAADAPRAERDTRRLLASLRAHNVPAVGFVSGQQLYVNGRQDEARVALLRQWLDAGVELGAEGFSHPNLFDTPPQEFRRDVLRGESVTAQLAAERGQTRLRYFSYPFLNVGPDRETKEAFERFLALRGMQIHKVTIDNLDWLFGKVYADALRRGDGAAMRRVEGEYVAYMERVFDFYERLSRDTVGREIPQVLMLTANALNCAKFDDLAAMLERRGYAFVTLEEAQGDPAYAQPDTYTGPWGISWLQRWAMARGAGFRDEPYLSPYMEQFDTYTKKWQGIKVNESK
jgi:peptidoglycan/xylan/chitin deacetylase (PgdA/CDA1 family)